MNDLKDILKSDTGVKMPMMEERLQALHEVCNVLVSKYGGTFMNVIRAANKSTQKLLRLIVDEFPVFRDEAVYQGQKGSLIGFILLFYIV
jgi:hypothetical protein